MTDIPNLNRLRYFVAVVDAGSFTAAAARLGIAKTVVSHQVAMLEKELNATLLIRNTRNLQLSESGRWFYQRALTILREAETAFGEMTQRASEPTGILSLTAPIEYGQTVVAPTVTAFLKRYPAMSVDVQFNDRVLDLVAANIDLAIRLGRLDDSPYSMRKLGNFQQKIVCSPELLRDLPADFEPHHLAETPWVGNKLLKKPLDWVLRKDQESVAVRVQAKVLADTTLAVMAFTLAGTGITALPDFLVVPEIEKGNLVALLSDWSLPDGGIHVIFPDARFRSAKVRLFVDMLANAERSRLRVD